MSLLLLLRGSAAPVTYTATVSGGLTSGGTATVSRGREIAALGGATTGGTAVVSRERSPQPSGGMASGGSATVSRGRSGAVSGGLAFGGSASSSFTPGGTYTYTGTGGAILAGSAATSYESGAVDPPVPPGEWIPLGGSAVRRSRVAWVYVATGGMIFGGSAFVGFAPATPEGDAPEAAAPSVDPKRGFIVTAVLPDEPAERKRGFIVAKSLGGVEPLRVVAVLSDNGEE